MSRNTGGTGSTRHLGRTRPCQTIREWFVPGVNSSEDLVHVFGPGKSLAEGPVHVFAPRKRPAEDPVHVFWSRKSTAEALFWKITSSAITTLPVRYVESRLFRPWITLPVLNFAHLAAHPMSLVAVCVKTRLLSLLQRGIGLPPALVA
jgi:hypothetical protein